VTTPLGVRKAWRTDMMETRQAELDVSEGTIPLELRPFEVATIRLALGG
jgi:hypothetical protein